MKQRRPQTNNPPTTGAGMLVTQSGHVCAHHSPNNKPGCEEDEPGVRGVIEKGGEGRTAPRIRRGARHQCGEKWVGVDTEPK